MGYASRNRTHSSPEVTAGVGPGADTSRAKGRDRRVALTLFLALLALAEPPAVYLWANRIEPWVLGMPFLFAYLLGVYLAMVGVLVWSMKRRL